MGVNGVKTVDLLRTERQEANPPYYVSTSLLLANTKTKLFFFVNVVLFYMIGCNVSTKMFVTVVRCLKLD